MSAEFFNPTPGTREKPIRKWLLLIAGILTWTITGVVLTAIAYLIWPAPRQVWQEYIGSFSAFLPLFLLLLVTPKFLGRPALTAITTSKKVRWNLVWIGFWSWGLLLIAETFVKRLRNPSDIDFNAPGISYLWPLLVCLFLLPIQTSSEELLFRGAIPQTLTTIFRNPKIVVIVSGVIFGAAHLSNPEAQAQPLISLIGYSVAGIGWGWVTYKTAGLELAIGAHTVNNFYGLLIVGYSNSAVVGSSIWTTPEVNMQESTIMSLIMMGIWIFALRRIIKQS
jgi:membrane protease YdiL (CAAX protease family)